MKVKWSEKGINQEVLACIGEKMRLLNNILPTKTNWINHILRRNCLLHEAIEGQMTEVIGVGGRRRRRTQLPDDVRKRRRYIDLRRK